MEKLSIEEKAKRYDEAIERARDVYTYYCDDREQLRKIESIFPELKESESERIVKAIKYALDHVFTNNTTVFEVTKEQCLAWLEKQGEHANFRNKIQIGDKVTRNEDGVLVNLSQLKRVSKKDEKQGEQKPEVKYVYTKFRIGDVIVEIKPNGYCQPVTVKYVGEGAYSCESDDGKRSLSFPIMSQDEYKLVEQKPAIKLERDDNGEPVLTPFEAELFSMMSEAWQDYSFGEEVNFAKIVKDHSIKLLERAKEQNPAWSEEDEKMIRGLIVICDEWTIRHSFYPIENCEIEKLKNWLESLKDRYTWKPSDEQMERLKGTINSLPHQEVLYSLYQDLLKLREE